MKIYTLITALTPIYVKFILITSECVLWFLKRILMLNFKKKQQLNKQYIWLQIKDTRKIYLMISVKFLTGNLLCLYSIFRKRWAFYVFPYLTVHTFIQSVLCELSLQRRNCVELHKPMSWCNRNTNTHTHITEIERKNVVMNIKVSRTHTFTKFKNKMLVRILCITQITRYLFLLCMYFSVAAFPKKHQNAKIPKKRIWQRNGFTAIFNLPHAVRRDIFPYRGFI